MSSFAVSYSELCEELINSGNNTDSLNDFIKRKNSVLTINEIKLVRRAIQKQFISRFNQRWAESYKKKSYFFKKNKEWLKRGIFKVSVDGDRPSCAGKKERLVEEIDDCEESLSPNYKRTTDRQYSLLNHEMERNSAENYKGTGTSALKFWNVLTEKLNAMGPPYRTVSQWQKVWSDQRRFHRRKDPKLQPKYMKTIKTEASHKIEEAHRADEEGKDIAQTGYKTLTSNKSKVADYLHSESEDYEQNYKSMHLTLSNDIVDEYSHADLHSQQHQQQQTTQESLIPNATLNYSQVDEDIKEIPQTHETSNVHIINAALHRSQPPLQPVNTCLIDETLYTLQTQIEQQTKLLEHLSQICSTMSTLMERQVNAIEIQTEAIRRQASATEHHTLVVNSFVDMIREKMPKVNSKTNLSNS